jgi:hypothetical protein
VSHAVWCSITALSSMPSKMTMEESHIHVMKPITGPMTRRFCCSWQNTRCTTRIVRHNGPGDRRKRATPGEPAPLRRLGEQKKSRIHEQRCRVKGGIAATSFVVNVAYRSCLPGVPMWHASWPSRMGFLCNTFGEALRKATLASGGRSEFR